MTNKFVDLTNSQIGEWHIDKYLGKGKWQCTCSCGTIKSVDGHELRRGATKSCGHDRRLGDLTGKQFGEWTVLKKSETRKRYWLCRCSCGYEKEVQDYTLIHNKSKSCGHESGRLKDLKGQTFGDWTVLDYVGNGIWRCRCSCGTIKEIHGEALRSGSSTSCGCKRYSNTIKSQIEKYGDFKHGAKRQKWQIEILNDPDKLYKFITNLIEIKGDKLSNEEIADYLGVTRTAIYEATKKFNITDYKYDKYHSVNIQEYQIYNFIKSIYNGNVIRNSRKLLNRKEIDIYLPDKRIAIEFNGNYWHSELVKNKYYHQEKTLQCIDNNIHLIHIFEYEWKDSNKREKIKNYLNNLINHSHKIYARDTYIKELDNSTAYEFEEKYHLSGKSNSTINIGIFSKDDMLLGIMTFGSPRFNSKYEYELIRLCYRDSINVIGGTQKLFQYFLDNYNPLNIIAYADLSKFTGEIYKKLGFQTRLEYVTPPNYIWLSSKGHITRYQAQKDKLVRLGGYDKELTEAEIMHMNGYIRIYDSGNIKYIWSR